MLLSFHYPLFFLKLSQFLCVISYLHFIATFHLKILMFGPRQISCCFRLFAAALSFLFSFSSHINFFLTLWHNFHILTCWFFNILVQQVRRWIGNPITKIRWAYILKIIYPLCIRDFSSINGDDIILTLCYISCWSTKIKQNNRLYKKHIWKPWDRDDTLRMHKIQNYLMQIQKNIWWLIGTHFNNLETIELFKLIAFFSQHK